MIEESRRCPYCDELIRYNAVKCKHCGSIITNSENIINGVITPETQVRIALSSKYEILEEIGRGGMASVYKAVQKNLNRHIALKVIHQNLIYDSEFLQRFHQESKLCASLTHPNIVTIHDEGVVNNVHYMAMEYLSGNDLQRIIKFNKKIIIDDAIKIIISVANALDYAHGKGLIHRDIKSANIFITNEGRTVLTDFGIAFATNSRKLTQTGSVIGTPEYMSPEQAKGLLSDSRSDIYSLGVVLFECLTGKLPFTSENPLTTIFKILNEKPPSARDLNKEVPQWLSTVVNKVLEKDPKQRFQTGKDFALALMNRKPVTSVVVNKRNAVPPKSPPKDAKKPANSIDYQKIFKSKITYLFIVLFCGIALSMYYLLKPPPPPPPTKGLIEKADSLYDVGNYTMAYTLYNEVFNSDHKNKGAAKDGLEKIRKNFVDRANNELEKAKADNSKSGFQKAIIIADSGLNYFNNYTSLLQIKSEAIEKIKEPPPPPPPPPKEVVKVPDVKGLQQAAAENMITTNKLTIGSKSPVYSSNRKGLVINQSPKSGVIVNIGTPVNLFIGE